MKQTKVNKKERKNVGYSLLISFTKVVRKIRGNLFVGYI